MTHMLPPDYLDNIADAVEELYSRLDETIIRDIARRIIKAGLITSTAAWQTKMVQQSGMLYDDVLTEVSKLTNVSQARVKEAFEKAGAEAQKWDNSIYLAAGLSSSFQLSPSAQQVLNAGIAKTGGQLNNLTLTTAVESQQTFIQAVTMAEMQVESGAFDYITAVKNAVLSAAGGAWVQYPSGHRSRLDVAVRRAVLTGVSQTTGEISLMNARAMGCDLMEITAHAGARPSHAVWQGRLVSLSGREGYLSLDDIGYGTGPGFKGWNCRHDWFPFFEGLSESAYPREVLDEYNNRTVEYNGEKIPYYDVTQMQRAQERKMRDVRRQLSALDEAIKNAPNEATKTALKLEFGNLSVKLKALEVKYRDFSSQTGLMMQKERLQALGFGKSVSQKAVWANKRELKKEAELDIIREEIRRDILSGKYPISLNVGNQNKHIKSSHSYVEQGGKSYIYGDSETAQVLVATYHGTGDIKLNKSNKWTKKEFVTLDRDIGVVVDEITGAESVTNRFSIHYSNKGTHIVPAERKKKY